MADKDDTKTSTEETLVSSTAATPPADLAPVTSSPPRTSSPSPPPSSTAPATSAPAAATDAAPPPDTAAPTDPKVAQLRLLFDSVDVEIIEAVLHEKGGNVDAAMDALLALSDPDYKPENPEELSQLEADEELARQLAREDELASARQRVHQPQAQGQRSSSLPSQQAQQQPLTYQPYVPKSRRTTGGGTGTGSGPSSPSIGSWQPPAAAAVEQPRQQGQYQQTGEPERDELDQLTEQFSKFADQGKRLFGNFMTRAKEQVGKIDEAIQRSASPTSSSSQPPAPPPKSASDSSSYWEVPSPLPRPSLSTTGGRTPSSSGATESALPDFTSPVSPAAAAASEPPSAAPPPVSSSATSTPSGSPSKPSAFARKIPGLLPRQSFSLLDAQKSPLPASPSATAGAKSPLGASPAALGLAGAAGAAGVGAGASVASAGRTEEEEEKSHYSLGDDDDSEDDMEYVRSPFQDDD
ncbi:hypothetical protein JCM6882_009632 [Rhodosporidiobolus microsporus]